MSDERRRRHLAPSLDDAELVRAAAAGDQASFGILVSRYEPLVHRVVRAETSGSGDAPDLVQEVFTRAWCRIGALREASRFRPWLLQIARRAVLDHARSRARRPVDPAVEASDPRWADPRPGPEELAAIADLARRVGVALEGLSRRDATVLTLAAQLGFGPSEIAEAMGLTSANAKVILHRARSRLRAALAAADGAP